MTLTISICIVNLGFIIDHIDSIEYNSKEKLNNPCIFNFQSYHFSEYLDIYNTNKNYGPFWARIKEDWLKLFPVDAGSMFPEKLDNELTAKDETAIREGIKKLMKVWPMIIDLEIFSHVKYT